MDKGLNDFNGLQKTQWCGLLISIVTSVEGCEKLDGANKMKKYDFKIVST